MEALYLTNPLQTSSYRNNKIRFIRFKISRLVKLPEAITPQRFHRQTSSYRNKTPIRFKITRMVKFHAAITPLRSHPSHLRLCQAVEQLAPINKTSSRPRVKSRTAIIQRVVQVKSMSHRNRGVQASNRIITKWEGAALRPRRDLGAFSRTTQVSACLTHRTGSCPSVSKTSMASSRLEEMDRKIKVIMTITTTTTSGHNLMTQSQRLSCPRTVKRSTTPTRIAA